MLTNIIKRLQNKIKILNQEIISLFKVCPKRSDFSQIRYNYYIYYDKENNYTSIISMDLAGCVYKLFIKN